MKNYNKILLGSLFILSLAFNSSAWWQPKPYTGLTWQWQISKPPSVASLLDVSMYDVDLFDTPKETIAAMKKKGIKVTCYFSAGTYEGWRPDWQEYFNFIKGEKYDGNEKPFLGKMDDWDERWLDVREIKLLEPIMRARLKLAKEKGCDCVEPDNMDSYTPDNIKAAKPTGSYTAKDQLAYNKKIAQWAHEEGLSVALKNDVDQLEDLVNDFDWALNEQCFQYNECDAYKVFIDANKAVFGVEYKLDKSKFCTKAYDAGYSWLKKKLTLDAWVDPCEVKNNGATITHKNVQYKHNLVKNEVIRYNGIYKTYDITGREIKGNKTPKGLYLVKWSNGIQIRNNINLN